MASPTTSPLKEPIRPPRSRYREERTLVRALLPLPGQSREAFKQNVRRLRTHCEQFNADVAGPCQWIIRFRPDSDKSIPDTQAFWEFFLEPERFVGEDEEASSDRRRLEAFEVAVLSELSEGMTSPPLASTLKASITSVAQLTPTNAAKNLFGRMKDYLRPHRLVLLKAAAEWILAKYVRGYQN